MMCACVYSEKNDVKAKRGREKGEGGGCGGEGRARELGPRGRRIFRGMKRGKRASYEAGYKIRLFLGFFNS